MTNEQKEQARLQAKKIFELHEDYQAGGRAVTKYLESLGYRGKLVYKTNTFIDTAVSAIRSCTMYWDTEDGNNSEELFKFSISEER